MKPSRETAMQVFGAMNNPAVVTGAFTPDPGTAITYIQPNPSCTILAVGLSDRSLSSTGLPGGAAVAITAPVGGVYSSCTVSAGSALVYTSAIA